MVATWSSKMRSLLSGAGFTLFLSLLFGVWGPHPVAASVIASPSAAPAMVGFASPTDPGLSLPAQVPIESPAPSSAPLPVASPSTSVQQRLDSLESKVDELIDRTSSSQTADIVDILNKIVVAVAIGISALVTS